MALQKARDERASLLAELRGTRPAPDGGRPPGWLRDRCEALAARIRHLDAQLGPDPTPSG